MSKKNIRGLRIAVFSIAVVFILYGVYIGEYIEVLNKGVKICLECIGIG